MDSSNQQAFKYFRIILIGSAFVILLSLFKLLTEGMQGKYMVYLFLSSIIFFLEFIGLTKEHFTQEKKDTKSKNKAVEELTLQKESVQEQLEILAIDMKMVLFKLDSIEHVLYHEHVGVEKPTLKG